MNFHAPKNSKVRHNISVLASATTAVTLLLGSAFVASPAMATEIPLPAINAEVKLNGTNPDVSTDRFIVKFSGTAKGNPGERGNAYGKTAKKYGITVKEVKQTSDGAQVISADRKLSADEVKSFVSSMKTQSNVEYAEPDALLQISATPNDTLYPKQWDLFEDKAGARVSNVWDKTTGEGQVVAVIDSGITSHPDLNANILPGYDMISTSAFGRDGNGRDANPQDEGDYRNSGDCGATSTSKSSWHGTHVAGTIAAVSNNATGVAGVAPGAKVVPIRALGACGGYSSDIADGIIWASGATVPGVPANANPARSINLSLGGTAACDTTTQNAINIATGRGSSVFVAAGNFNTSASTVSPANCNNVIVVAATNREGNRAGYSNYGPTVDIAAPGGDSAGGIASTVNAGETVPTTDGYAYMQGTSMATPHVAGIAALMLAADPSLSPADIELRLKTTARAFPGVCAEGCGSGLVDASAAVVFPAPEPVVQPTPAPEPVVVSPVSSSVPTITGTVKVGSTLTANAGSWGPEGVALAYQWNAAGQTIEGANASTYTIPSEYAGKALTVTVTGSKAGYTSKSEISANTAATANGSLTTANPVVTGTAKVGYRLTVNPGTWGPAPVAITYQWYRSGVAISGATASSYILTGSDYAKTMTVRVTGRKTGYTAVYRQSAATVSVAAGDLKGEFPKITGTTKVGNTLTANPGLWTSGTSVSYQWYRDGVAVSGATSKYFALTSADLGKQIKVRALGKKTGYTSRAYYSYSTVKIT